MKKYGTFVTVGIFAAAMGILEAAVVVYLRQTYYPSGFDFPLAPIPGRIFLVELIREACTIVMLVCAGALAAKTPLRRFAYFLFAFGVWDLLYYAGLKLFLGWPPSLLTWDVLFLMPVVWVAPVLAPVICALTMVLFSLCVVVPLENGYEVRVSAAQWGLMTLGAGIVFCTFILDHVKLLVQGGVFTPEGAGGLRQLASQYVPADYNWCFFALGEILVLVALALFLKRSLTRG